MPIWEQISGVVGPYLPRLAGALVILTAGWLAAVIVAAILRALLRRTSLDDRIARQIAGDEKLKQVDLESWISRTAFYVMMLFVLVAFFHALGLPGVSEPLNLLLATVFAYLPRVVAALALGAAAWALATVMRLVVRRVFGAASLGALREGAGVDQTSLAATAADAVYWLVLLLFAPAILGALQLDGILAPVQAMMTQFLAYLPKLLGAAVIFGAGWLAARVLQRIVTQMLGAAGLDRLQQRLRLSTAAGWIVYALILIPTSIAALNALGLDAVTAPASNMLSTLLAAVPALFGGALILLVTYLAAQLAAGAVANLLRAAGFDRLPARLGLLWEARQGWSASDVAGRVAMYAIVLFGAAEAARMMGFAVVQTMVAEVVAFAGHILVGLVLFSIGLFLARIAGEAVTRAGGPQAPLLSTAVRIAVITFAGAMALRQMGLANEIVSLAFGLILGAIAVAIAIAFGIGGRDVAGRKIEEWSQMVESPSSRYQTTRN